MVIIDIVINTLLGRLTLDPAGMHCPAWDDAFVSSLLLLSVCLSVCLSVYCLHGVETNFLTYGMVIALEPNRRYKISTIATSAGR